VPDAAGATPLVSLGRLRRRADPTHLALAGIVVLAAVLRFPTPGVQSFWLDEGIAIDSMRHGFGAMFDSIAHTEGNPPFYFVLGWGWTRIFGDSEAGIRSLSALFGLATVPVVFAIGRRLATPRVALVAAALVATNPLLVWFSQEARPYALVVLLSSLSVLLLLRVLERPTTRGLAGWAVVCALTLATHYFAGLLVAIESAWLLARVRPLRLPAAAVGAVALAVAALAPLIAEQRSIQDFSFVQGESLLTRFAAQVPKQFLIGYDAPLERIATVGCVLLIAVAIALLLTRSEPRERRAAVIGASLGLGVLVVALVLGAAVFDYLLSRYVIGALVPLILVAAAGYGARRAGRAGMAAAAVMCAVSVAVVIAVDARVDLQRDDWRGVAEALPPPTGPRAFVISPIHGSIPLALYVPRLRPLPPAGAVVSEIAAVAIAKHEAGQTRHAPAIPPIPPPPGFTEVARRSGSTYSLVVYRAPQPLPVAPPELAGTSLEPGAPDLRLEP
jgi:mannosyltransferase